MRRALSAPCARTSLDPVARSRRRTRRPPGPRAGSRRARRGCPRSAPARGVGAPVPVFLILTSRTVARAGSRPPPPPSRRRRRPAAAARTASARSAELSTSTTRTPDGAGSVTLAATRVTSAPLRAAARARAQPCRPVERLPRNRTGSMGSWVPPAEMTTRRPARSCGATSARAAAAMSSRVGQPARPRVGAGEPAHRGLEHVHPAVPQRRHVGPGGGVPPHLGVHRGSHQHRARHGEQRRGQQVVAQPGRRAGQQVGGGRGDDHQLGLDGRARRARRPARRRRRRWSPARRTAPPTSRGRRTPATPGWAPPGRRGRPR